MRACVLGVYMEERGASSNSISLHVMLQVHGCVTTGVIYWLFALAIFPPEKNWLQSSFHAGKWLYNSFTPVKRWLHSGIFPFLWHDYPHWKTYYVVDFSPVLHSDNIHSRPFVAIICNNWDDIFTHNKDINM